MIAIQATKISESEVREQENRLSRTWYDILRERLFENKKSAKKDYCITRRTTVQVDWQKNKQTRQQLFYNYE